MLTTKVICVKFPTRQRKDQFFRVLDLYRALACDPDNIRFVITCDNDDETMNNDQVRSRIAAMGAGVFYGNHKTKIEACNADVPLDGWDILVLASDDMIPRVRGWDNIIREKMEEHFFPDLDGVLNYWDGHQGDRINTLPVMGRKWYRRFNYIYNPIYRTMYCDTELTDVSRLLNREAYIDQVIIEHKHPFGGEVPMDDLYRRNSDSSFDQKVYMARRANNFYLNTVLIRQPGRVGDILITLPVAKHYHDENCIVYWLCPESYHDLFRNIDYAIPVTQPPRGITRDIDLSFGFGGSPESWWGQHKANFESFTVAKYYLAGVSYQRRWNLTWERNYIRENDLFQRITAGKSDYILTHETTHLGRFIDLDFPDKIELEQVDDYNIFDWYKVIDRAKAIHCIDSSLSNFIEAVPEFYDKEKHIYLSAREPNYYLRSIYKNNWIYELH